MALTPAPNQSLVIPVHELNQVGDARRRIISLAHRQGFDEATRGRVALIVNEAGANLVRHARQGQLVVRALYEADTVGLEVLTLDRGPGMADVAQCMRDGYSTAGTAGTGLGALKRLADVFDIHSEPEVGTAMLMQVWAGQAVPRQQPIEFGVVCAPHRGESICGDGWAVRHVAGRVDVLVADGLGHGEAAAEASQAAARVFVHSEAPASDLLPRMHEALRRTRGAAVAISEIDPAAQAVQFSCIGNISGAVVRGPRQQQMIGQHGTVGLESPRLRSFSYEMPRGTTLVMHSDGLTSRWRLTDDALLRRHHPSLVAGVLYRDHRRGSDDVTVALARVTGRGT